MNYPPSFAKAYRKKCSPCLYAARRESPSGSREARAEYSVAYARRNPEARRSSYLRHARQKAASDPGYFNCHAAFRRAERYGAVPPELTRGEAIDATLPFYREAARLTEETGVKHEVDHRLAIGLGGMHVPENLQVLPATEHRKKSLRDAKAVREARRAPDPQ